MSVQITDCTIRDGGYLFGKNSKPEFVRAVMKGLAEAGIDFVETGFLQTNVTGESLVYGNSVDARKYLPEDKHNTNFLGFCDNSRYSINELDDYDGKSFKWLRISFAKHEVEDSLRFCRQAQEKGYTVQFNPMDTVSYTDEERESLIEKANQVKPGSLSIVDTFGAMYLEDLHHIFKQMDSLLDRDIKIGLHSHDNLGLSNALAETMIMLAQASGRNVIVDGSLFGMGRGAGNASTEILANYINKYHGGKYNMAALLDVIENYIEPAKRELQWGYTLPMFVCGATHAHVDNVAYLQKNMSSDAKEMYEVINTMSASERTRYGAGYSKTDFTILQKAYDEYKSGKVRD